MSDAYMTVRDDRGNVYKLKLKDAGDGTFIIGTTPMPTPDGALGEYMVTGITGTMAAGIAGNSPVFSFRFGGATFLNNLGLIKRIAVSMSSLGTGFTAGIGIFNLFVSRAFTVAMTGGTDINPAGGMQKLRTAFGNSLLADFRIPTTAALTLGTQTLDTSPLSSLMFAVTAATNTVMLPTTDLLNRDLGRGDNPLVLTGNEGFQIQATVPATGTWQMQVMVDWFEANQF